MIRTVRPVTADDKLLIAAALLNAGITGRIKMLRRGLRVVFAGPNLPVADLLNGEGYLNAGAEAFTRFSFNGVGEVFVHYAAN